MSVNQFKYFINYLQKTNSVLTVSVTETCLLEIRRRGKVPLARSHARAHTHLLALQPLNHVGVSHSSSSFCSILHTFQTAKLKEGCGPKPISNLTSRAATYHITLLFICKFLNAEKCNDKKYSLHLVLQNFYRRSTQQKL
jgi:hypothetical protein